MSPYELIAKLQEIDAELVNTVIGIKDKAKAAELEELRIDLAHIINKAARICR